MKHFFIKTAYLLGKESKCVSRQVGAIIVRNGRIISTGINGTPPGYINCNEKFPEYNPIIDREEHHEWSKTYEIHAEINALLFSAKNGISTDNTELYVILQPCDDCLKAITAAGIKKIYYVYPYDKASKDNKLWNIVEHEQIKDKEIIEWIKKQES